MIGLDHVVIGVAEWNRATAFYRDVLGAVVVPMDGERVSFRVGRTQLNVHDPGVDLSDNVARLPVRPGGSDICFEWSDDISDAIRHLQAHGVPVEEGPVPEPVRAGMASACTFGTLTEVCSSSSATAEPVMNAGVAARGDGHGNSVGVWQTGHAQQETFQKPTCGAFRIPRRGWSRCCVRR